MRVKRLSFKRTVLLIVTVLVLLLIFAQSMLPQNLSAKESGWVLERIVNPVLNALGLRPLTHNGVRKIAHVFEFAILAFSCSPVAAHRSRMSGSISSETRSVC